MEGRAGRTPTGSAETSGGGSPLQLPCGQLAGFHFGRPKSGVALVFGGNWARGISHVSRDYVATPSAPYQCAKPGAESAVKPLQPDQRPPLRTSEVTLATTALRSAATSGQAGIIIVYGSREPRSTSFANARNPAMKAPR